MGLEVFRVIANSDRLKNIPIILETPVGNDDSVYGEEIKLLEWLEGRPIDNPEFIAKKDELSKLGSKERAEHLKKFEAKNAKAEKKSAKRKNGEDIMSALTKKAKKKE